MRRLFVALLASLLLAGFVAPAVGAAPVAAAASAVPKVVVIVGPAGGATNRYRAEAAKAAALARKYTPDVTELYSPNATWPAVRSALQGASLVIYMGHGNGWPSRYRDSLYPPSQNGFGLNPKAGGGDYKHQYFGEARIAKSVKLADNAVVLLNHLCYASGNTEPGLAEGTLDLARQRVDNFAAGFIRAGAAAVVAEAYASPNHMIRSILGTKKNIESAWRHAPSRNGHAFAFKSTRSPGYIAQMDPEKGISGFSRSIVLKAGLASDDVLRGARGSAVAAAVRSDPLSLTPSLAAAGISAEDPTLASTTASTTIRYKVPYTVDHRSKLPEKVTASVRWDALSPVAADRADEAGAGSTDSATTGFGADPTADPAASPSDDPNAAPTAEPGTDATSDATGSTDNEYAADTAAVPDLGLVVAERLGDVVAPVKVKLGKQAFAFDVATPTAPGRYRLTVTLHDADGVAFDAATQAILPTLIVRVTGDVDAEIVAPASAEMEPGAATVLSLWVANLGVAAWGHQAYTDVLTPEGSTPKVTAILTGQWVALGVAEDADQVASAASAAALPAELPAALAPGTVIGTDLRLYAPIVPGDYLLLLDILTPEHGSLVAKGVEPTIIRVKVAEPQPADTIVPAADGTGGSSAAPETPAPMESAAPAE